MIRALAVLLLVSLTLAVSLAAAASGRDTVGSAAATAAAGKITLRGRPSGGGPWRAYVRFKLIKTDITSFAVCAVWNQPPPSQTCRSTPGNHLPTDTALRLEQHPIASALKRADSPGWGMVALSPETSLGAVLSNTVSGNKLGTYSYRVTLRNRAGKVLATSNSFKAYWHR